jgi:hypothetical protein
LAQLPLAVVPISNGQTGVAFGPNAASGGPNNIIGLYNAYNRVSAISQGKDNGAAWTQTSAGNWEPLDNNTANRITVLDGLQTNGMSASINGQITNITSAVPQIGIDIDSTSATPFCISTTAATAKGNASCQVTSYPLLGLHYFQPVQNAANSTAGIYSSGFNYTVPWSY